MSGVGFLYSTGKSVTISDPDKRPREIFYVTFRLSFYPTTVDPRAPNTVHQFEFSLHLPHSSLSSSVNILLLNSSVVTNKSSETTFNVTLSGISDDQLNKMPATALRDTLSAQRDSISASTTSKTSRSLKSSTPNSSTTTVAMKSTPKMDNVRSPSSVGSIYTGPLDCLDNQSCFNNIYGFTPEIILITF